VSLLLNTNQKVQIAVTALGENIKQVPEGIHEYKIFLSFLCFG